MYFDIHHDVSVMVKEITLCFYAESLEEPGITLYVLC